MKNEILLLFLLISTSIYSQTTEPIQADRPDQTETPALVPKGMFQVETGFTFQKNDALSKSLGLPSTLWKYGVNDNFELRLITEFLSEEIYNKKLKGFTPVSYTHLDVYKRQLFNFKWYRFFGMHFFVVIFSIFCENREKLKSKNESNTIFFIVQIYHILS